MSSGGSTKVIIIAFLANLGIALAKFAGAFVSGSAALLAEAIHSVVDTANQVLLLVGAKKAGKVPTEKHPLGYGRESFFWSFVVSVMLFSLGGLFAIYEGAHKLKAHEPMQHFWIVIAILGVSIVLEIISFRAAFSEIRRNNPYGSLRKWFKHTTSSSLLVVFTEDAGALVGLVIAAVCVSVSHVLGDPAWDAYGSIGVGLLLVGLAVMLSAEIKSLLIGEAPSTDYRPEVQKLVAERLPGGRVLNLLALQMGDSEVMVSIKIHPGTVQGAAELIAGINAVEARMRERFPEIRWSFVEPDYED